MNTPDLSSIIHALNTEAKSNLFFRGDEALISEIPGFVSTGSTLLDLAISYPQGMGIALSRITDIFGEPTHGKTTLGLITLANLQQMGGIAVYIDAEARLDKIRASNLGFDVNRAIFIEPDSLEQGFLSTTKVVKQIRSNPETANAPIIVAWDPISNSPTKTELSGSKWGGGMMERPRIIREELRKATYPWARAGAGIIFMDHVHGSPEKKTKSRWHQETDEEKQEESFTPNVETSGGGGIKYLSSTRIWVRKSGWYVPDGVKVEGIICRARIVKNSLTDPYREVEFPITRTGIDDAFSLFAFLVAEGDEDAVSKAGSWYTIHLDDREVKFQGGIKFHETLASNPDIYDQLQIKTIEHWQQKYYG